jgi:hypothetical protein
MMIILVVIDTNETLIDIKDEISTKFKKHFKVKKDSKFKLQLIFC